MIVSKFDIITLVKFMKENKFELLRNKKIISILIGDTKFTDKQIGMPYLTGPQLCEISTKFGLPKNYWQTEIKPSRWVYMDELLKYSIEKDKINNLLGYLFGTENFFERLKGLPASEIESSHKEQVKIIIDNINSVLYFGGNELQVIGNNFIVKDIKNNIEIDMPEIKKIDVEYIKGLHIRSQKDIEEGNFDSALTKARTMVEEVLVYIIEQHGDIVTKKGDIGRMYSQVKGYYKMQQSSEFDNRINELLQGLEKIIHAIGDMRNMNSDSHGVGSSRINISDYHARLVINSAISFSEFILSVHLAANRDGLIGKASD